MKIELSGVETVATPGGLSTYAETPDVAIAEGVAQLVPPESLSGLDATSCGSPDMTYIV